MNIFAEMWHSIVNIKSYAGFAKQSRKRVFVYGLLINTIYVMATTILPVAAAWGPAGNVQAIVEMLVPDFKLEDDRLWVEKPITVKEYDDMMGGIYIDVDTDREIVSGVSDVDLLMFDHVLIADAENMIVRYDGKLIRSSFAELSWGDWSRDTLLEKVFPYIKQVLLYGLVLLLLVEYLGFYAGAWIVAWFGSLMARALRYKVPMRQLYNMSVHARTISILLKGAAAWMPGLIPFYYATNYGLSAVYVWRALLYMKEQEQPQQNMWPGETM